MPTTEEKVKLFVKALDLGLPAQPTTSQQPPTPVPAIRPPSTTSIGTIGIPACHGCNYNSSFGKRNIERCPTGEHRICENTYSK